MGLWGYIIVRFVQSLVVLFFVSIATFSLMHAVPGDRSTRSSASARPNGRRCVRPSNHNTGSINRCRPVFSLRQQSPPWRHGDHDYRPERRPPALSLVVPATMELAFVAMLFAISVGVPLGIIAAVKQGKWQDHVAGSSPCSAPRCRFFWLGLLLAICSPTNSSCSPRSGQLDVGMRRPPQVTGFISIDALLAGETEVFWSRSGISSCPPSCSAPLPWGSSPACCVRRSWPR